MKLLSVLSILLLLSNLTIDAQEITILHTNDMHSHLNGDAPSFSYSPLTINNDETTGGFSRIASVIKTTKKSADHPVLVVDAGDFLMGTFFHTLEEKTGFQLHLMHMMGYDFAALGNHEFDFGPKTLGNIIYASSKQGAIPQLLLSNAKFHRSSDDDLLEDLYTDGLIAEYAIKDIQGIRIGLFALMGKDADHVAPGAKPITFEHQIRKAKKISRFLKLKKKCDLVLCLSHGGVNKNESNQWEGEDIELAKIKHLDVVIGGHTHSLIRKPVIINGTPVVQASCFGKKIGKLHLTRDGNQWKISDYDLIPINDGIEGDVEIQRIIDNQQKLIIQSLPENTRKKFHEPVIHFPYDLKFDEYGDPANSNLGPLIADAIHHYCNHTKEGADIALIAAGMIRTQYRAGEYSAEDIFRSVSLGRGSDHVPGYALSRLYVTGKELKGIMEVLMIAHKSSNANYIYFSGISAHVDLSKGFLKKIRSLAITDHTGNSHAISFSKKDPTLYSIVADSYMLKFIGLIKDMTFGLIKVKPKYADGSLIKDMNNCVIDMDPDIDGIQEGKQWLALLSLFSTMKEQTSENVPILSTQYKAKQHIFIDLE